MADESWRLRLDPAAVAALADDADARQLAVDAGSLIAVDARAHAPRRTGEGARSIQPWPGRDSAGWHADVSWDEDHFYMSFSELGTSRQPETPYLRPAIDRYLNL